MRFEDAIDRSIRAFYDKKASFTLADDSEEGFIFTPDYFDDLEKTVLPAAGAVRKKTRKTSTRAEELSAPKPAGGFMTREPDEDDDEGEDAPDKEDEIDG